MADFHLPGAEAKHAPDLRLEPVHLVLDLALRVDERHADGVVDHTIRARSGGARSIRFDAVELTIVSVEDPSGAELDWSYDGEGIDVTWAEPFDKGEERVVRIGWAVDDPVDGLHFSAPTDERPDRPRWAATDHETERARYWLPCIDHLSVRTTVEMSLTADAGFTALGPGLQVGHEANDDGTATTRWRLEQRCPAYLLCLAVGEWVRHDIPAVDDRELAVFAPAPYTEDHLRRSFGGTDGFLRWMEERLGVRLAYPKYFQFAAEGIGGAMENISLVSWDARFVADERFEAEYGWVVDRVNVHEMAHSWFGDAVVCRDFSQTWLKESWATYMESVWLEEEHGVPWRAMLLDRNRRAYFDESDGSYARPIMTRRWDSSWDMFDRHLYPGGAARLHMLRRLLGEADFWEGVRSYLEGHMEGLAETDSFRRCMEQASGRSLSRFFEQWFQSPGYPKLDASTKWDGDAGELTLTLKQTQEDADKGIGLFRFPLTVAFAVGDHWVRRTVEVRDGKHVVAVPLDAKPDQVVLDPEGELVAGISFAPGAEMLARQLSAGPSMAARIQAAHLLAATPRRSGVRALERVCEKEGFWGLRATIAEALGKAKTKDAAEALARLVLAEDDPRAMSAFTGAADSMREPVLAEALRTWLDRPERPYVAAGAALAALGAQRTGDPADHARLAAAAREPSWNGWVQAGALRGLGALRTEEGREVIREVLADRSQTAWLRGVAAHALASSGRFGDRGERAAALDALVEATRDREAAVRRAAGAALGALGEAGGADAMDAAAASVAHQWRPALQRAKRKLGRDGERSAAGLKKQVEELEGTVRTLRQRVTTLEER